MQLEREIDDLRRQLAAQTRADGGVSRAIEGILSARTTHTDLLGMIVETAAHVIGARGGSLLLLDEQNDELVFEVAVGSEHDELTGTRLDLGHGIAGLVATSGQPMAITDAESDPRVAQDIATRIGYVPSDLLCVPLAIDDQIVGVLELVDKQDGTSFTGADMASLGVFATQAAVAIHQSHAHHVLIGDLQTDVAYQRTTELAALVNEIAAHGEREVELCRTVLQGVLDYLRPELAAVEERTAQ